RYCQACFHAIVSVRRGTISRVSQVRSYQNCPCRSPQSIGHVTNRHLKAVGIEDLDMADERNQGQGCEQQKQGQQSGQRQGQGQEQGQGKGDEQRRNPGTEQQDEGQSKERKQA